MKNVRAETMAKINGLNGLSGSVTFADKYDPVKRVVIIEYKDGRQVFKTKVDPK